MQVSFSLAVLLLSRCFLNEIMDNVRVSKHCTRTFIGQNFLKLFVVPFGWLIQFQQWFLFIKTPF